MTVQIQLRRDTAANWTSVNPVLAEGEVGLETDTNLFKFGDGSTSWTGLSYVTTGSGSGGSLSIGIPGIDGADAYDWPIPGPPGAASSIPGPTGPAGPAGTGFPGMDGEDAYDWPIPGPPGPTGAGGSAGSQGAQGPIGVPGTDGEDAYDWPIPGPAGASGGGGSAYRPYIDTITLDGTYGDDFTASSLDAKWTARNQASETFQLGGGTWMQYDITNAAADRGQFFQTDGGGDMEIVLTFARNNWGTTGEMFGPMFIDSSGNGIAATFYDNSAGFYMMRVATYAYTSTSSTVAMFDKSALDGATVYIAIRVVGSTFDARYSLNGFTWSEYCQSDNYSFTRNRLGFGRFFGTPTHDRIAVDRFNKI